MFSWQLLVHGGSYGFSKKVCHNRKLLTNNLQQTIFENITYYFD